MVIKMLIFGRCVAAHQGVVLDLVEGGVLGVHLVLGQLCLQDSSWFTHRKQTKNHLVIKYHVENYGHAHTNVDRRTIHLERGEVQKPVPEPTDDPSCNQVSPHDQKHPVHAEVFSWAKGGVDLNQGQDQTPQ